jgi:8-oxo-dGTP pyrophosphatase MutT (NUDIX family)
MADEAGFCEVFLPTMKKERIGMDRQELMESIRTYQPFNEQEEMDKSLILNWIETQDDAFSRDNTVAHMTASAWVVNKDRSRVLMVYHNIYDSWSWLGGHADGETDLLAVAIREVKEEAGISGVRPVSEKIFSLESLTVDGHVKRGKYVSSHLHLNVTYLLEADSEEQVFVKEDENSGVGWFTPEEALKKSTEPWFVERVYGKLVEKMKKND